MSSNFISSDKSRPSVGDQIEQLTDVDVIHNAMVRAVSDCASLYYRYMTLDDDGYNLSEERKTILSLANQCYKTLAYVENAIEMKRYGDENETKGRAVCASEIVRDVVSAFRSRVISDVVLEDDCGGTIYCVCHPERLSFCLANLIENAYKNVGGEGTIRVSLKRGKDGIVLLSVSDSGFGMSEEVYQKAVMGEKSCSGLNILKAFCETVDSKPIIETTENGGTTVSVRLPAADKPSGDEMHSPDEPWVGGRFIHGSVLAYKLESVRTILPKI